MFPCCISLLHLNVTLQLLLKTQASLILLRVGFSKSSKYVKHILCSFASNHRDILLCQFFKVTISSILSRSSVSLNWYIHCSLCTVLTAFLFSVQLRYILFEDCLLKWDCVASYSLNTFLKRTKSAQWVHQLLNCLRWKNDLKLNVKFAIIYKEICKFCKVLILQIFANNSEYLFPLSVVVGLVRRFYHTYRLQGAL